MVSPKLETVSIAVVLAETRTGNISNTVQRRYNSLRYIPVIDRSEDYNCHE